MTRFTKLCCALLAVTALALASPVPAPELKDFHQTTSDLYATEGRDALSDPQLGQGRFAVAVERIDQLVDVDEANKTGSLLAARVVDVIVMFDVRPNREIYVNGELVPTGLTNIKLEAGMIMGVTELGANMTKEEIAEAFEVGIIGVEVRADAEDGTIDGVPVTKVTVSERITEINGVEVVQNDLVQQLFIIRGDGSVERQSPCAAASGRHPGSDRHHGRPCFHAFRDRLSAWYQRQSPAGQTFFIASLSFFFGSFLFAITRIFVLIARHHDDEDEYDGAYLDIVKFDKYEVIPVSDDDDRADLPEYAKNGYTAVDTDEKAADEEK